MSDTVKRALLKGNKYCKVWDGVILAGGKLYIVQFQDKWPWLVLKAKMKDKMASTSSKSLYQR